MIARFMFFYIPGVTRLDGEMRGIAAGLSVQEARALAWARAGAVVERAGCKERVGPRAGRSFGCGLGW